MEAWVGLTGGILGVLIGVTSLIKGVEWKGRFMEKVEALERAKEKLERDLLRDISAVSVKVDRACSDAIEASHGVDLTNRDVANLSTKLDEIHSMLEILIKQKENSNA